MLQTGIELIGSDTVAAVAEVLRVALDALEAAGVRNVSVDLTLPNLVEALARSEEHTYELQSLMCISYVVLLLSQNTQSDETTYDTSSPLLYMKITYSL